MQIRRSGNYGFVEADGGAVYSFDLSGQGRGWEPTSIPLRQGRASYFMRRMHVAGYDIVPMGNNNDLPGEVQRLLDKFYAGEGILGKIAGLQWGEGPRFFEDAIDTERNLFYKRWTLQPEIEKELEEFEYKTFLHRCLVDMVHMNGFFVKFVRNRAPRIGGRGRLLRLEHIPYQRARLLYPPVGKSEPEGIVVGDFPFPDPQYMEQYPIFDPSDPFRHPVSARYYNVYSFCKDFVSTPRFLGALDWLELAGTLAPLLHHYNLNSSALSLHIESPQSYWDQAEERLKAVCARKGETYSKQMLEDYKDECMERFSSGITGMKNAGKYMHTSRFFNEEANDFDGWKVTPIDKKMKEYIDAQIAISDKADAAAASGFGIDPVLANLILNRSLGSGSEKLYSIKVYNASETAIPDMILCRPVQDFINANHPGTPVRIGLYRTPVEAEQNVSPENRMKQHE